MTLELYQGSIILKVKLLKILSTTRSDYVSFPRVCPKSNPSPSVTVEWELEAKVSCIICDWLKTFPIYNDPTTQNGPCGSHMIKSWKTI